MYRLVRAGMTKDIKRRESGISGPFCVLYCLGCKRNRPAVMLPYGENCLYLHRTKGCAGPMGRNAREQVFSTNRIKTTDNRIPSAEVSPRCAHV